MKAIVLSETATASAGCGSSSNTGMSPNVRPGPNIFRTCSRPSADVITGSRAGEDDAEPLGLVTLPEDHVARSIMAFAQARCKCPGSGSGSEPKYGICRSSLSLPPNSISVVLVSLHL